MTGTRRESMSFKFQFEGGVVFVPSRRLMSSLVLPVSDHLLPQRSQLHRAGAQAGRDRLPQFHSAFLVAPPSSDRLAKVIGKRHPRRGKEAAGSLDQNSSDFENPLDSIRLELRAEPDLEVTNKTRQIWTTAIAHVCP
jgi:hypothetical protein